MRGGTRCRGGSRTTSRCPSSTCTSRCTRRSSDPRASRSSCRSARSRCTAGRSTASPRTGSTRRTATPTAARTARRPRPIAATSRARTTWRGCASCSTGSARPRTPASSSRACASTSSPPRSTSSRPRATSSRCRRAPRRSTSPTRCTPRSGTACIGARVNGRLVPLESTLDNGDLVEVFTSKAAGAGPSRDWLTFVKSPRARNKIRAWFSKERREEAIEHGATRSPSRCASRTCRSSGC